MTKKFIQIFLQSMSQSEPSHHKHQANFYVYSSNIIKFMIQLSTKQINFKFGLVDIFPICGG